MDWLDLLAVQGTLKSLLQYHSSKASILWCSAFFIFQLSHPYMTTGKTIALTRRTFADKVQPPLYIFLIYGILELIENLVYFHFIFSNYKITAQKLQHLYIHLFINVSFSKCFSDVSYYEDSCSPLSSQIQGLPLPSRIC